MQPENSSSDESGSLETTPPTKRARQEQIRIPCKKDGCESVFTSHKALQRHSESHMQQAELTIDKNISIPVNKV